jgi:hypothetical protein
MKTPVEPKALVATNGKPAARKRSLGDSQASKQSSRPAVAPSATPSVEASTPLPRPFLRFYHSESLRAKTLSVLTTIEEAEDGRQHRKALADIVCELTDSGMDYYFLRPLKVARAGFFVEQSANIGMGATTRILGSVIRNIIGGMDNRQLISVCGYIRQLMD